MTKSFEVKDGSRILKFNGRILGESSSWHRKSNRWIEFTLYKTENGSYVLSRIGVSLIFHGAACDSTEKYILVEVSPDDLSDDAIPCSECQPSTHLPFVFPEKYRYWAQVNESPEVILQSLYKYDRNGMRYLTKVAERLLEDAAYNDQKIDYFYRMSEIVEIIP